MLTTNQNERIDNYSPTDNPRPARKISTECHNVGAVDQRIPRYDWAKPVAAARGRRGSIEEWVELFELWCSIRKGGTQNQSALFLTAGGRDLYSLLRNLTFPEAPAKLPWESLKLLLLNHLLPTEFQANERAKFNSMIRADHVPYREFILQLNKQASHCNYGDRLEERMCDRLVAGINNLTLQRLAFSLQYERNTVLSKKNTSS
ncbi:unnamed protein product [Echinostoma caproni]|uniref:Retrotransposon gag domain-containing protein n=1 Tax=Echinostoma caproni TaxID=27848 RepID=A0A183ARU7_9TREM|nr:unnamed protein product [Echinostoma caproni]